MSAYVASERIERVVPRLVIGRATGADIDASAPTELETDDPFLDLAASADDDPLLELLAAAREHWSQLTFYVFHAEGWP